MLKWELETGDKAITLIIIGRESVISVNEYGSFKAPKLDVVPANEVETYLTRELGLSTDAVESYNDWLEGLKLDCYSFEGV